jgi:hypothetical protein
MVCLANCRVGKITPVIHSHVSMLEYTNRDTETGYRVVRVSISDDLSIHRSGARKDGKRFFEDAAFLTEDFICLAGSEHLFAPLASDDRCLGRLLGHALVVSNPEG